MACVTLESNTISGYGKALALIKLDVPNIERLRHALRQNYSRVSDLFKDWDHDCSGTVSKEEFRNVLRMLSLKDMADTDADALFDELDQDRSGSIDYAELHSKLRVGQDVILSLRRQRNLERFYNNKQIYYCTPFSGMKQQPAAWHSIRGVSPRGDRLHHAGQPRSRPPSPPRCTVVRPPAPEVPLLARTTPNWSPSTPRGMRIALRPIESKPAHGALGLRDDAAAAVLGVSLDTVRRRLESELSDATQLPPTPWRKIHMRSDLNTASSDHSNSAPSTPKARARRLAAIVAQMPT